MLCEKNERGVLVLADNGYVIPPSGSYMKKARQPDGRG